MTWLSLADHSTGVPKENRNRVVGKAEGSLFDHKKLWKMVRNPIYAGVNVEKWTKYQPVKCVRWSGVSWSCSTAKPIKANEPLLKSWNKIAIHDNIALRNATVRGTRNNDFAFKHYVMCPEYQQTPVGSTSRAKPGKYYSYYHCDKRGHKLESRKKILRPRSMISLMT